MIKHFWLQKYGNYENNPNLWDKWYKFVTNG